MSKRNNTWIRIMITTNDPANLQQFQKYKMLIDKYLVGMAKKYLRKDIYVEESIVGHDPVKNIYYLKVVIKER